MAKMTRQFIASTVSECTARKAARGMLPIAADCCRPHNPRGKDVPAIDRSTILCLNRAINKRSADCFEAGLP